MSIVRASNSSISAAAEYVRILDADATGATDSTTAFMAAINTAGGKPIWVPKGTYRVQLAVTDQDVHLVGPGTLIQQQGQSAVSVTRTLGSPVSVTAISTVQIGPDNPSTGVTSGNVSTLTLASLTGIKQGDLLLLGSQDTYPFCTALATITGAGTTNVWKNGFVPVHGLGLTTTLTGTVNIGDTIVGATSGASALVMGSAATTTAGQTVLTFAQITGTFNTGENLTVGGSGVGAAVGLPYVVMSGLLLDTYTTTPTVRKVPTGGTFILDGLRIKASGDIDTLVGAANRPPAVLLKGVAYPRVNVTFESAWGRGVHALSCYGGTFDVDIIKLANNAATSEGAYGYGVDLAAATEQCTVTVRGGNCRHGFTTNVHWGSFAAMTPVENGVPKYNVCRDSYIKNSVAASFDTHWGAYFTEFLNCVSVNSVDGGRTLTTSIGFQNRGFGTKYVGCSDNGSQIGFLEDHGALEAGFPHIAHYRDCVSDNYQYAGFMQATTLVSNDGKIDWAHCEARGDGRAVNAPWYQAGIITQGGILSIRQFTSRRFNGAAMRHQASAGRLEIIDFYADYMECATSTSGIRFDGAPTELNIRNYRIRPNPFNSTSPLAAFRVAGGAVTMNIDGYSMLGNTGAATPFASITGGSLAVNWIDPGGAVAPTAQRGDVSATLIPRSSSPVQIWNTPLTSARTVTLSTTAGVPLNGDSFRVVRTAAATGGSTLTVAGKTLAAGQWADVSYDGSTWLVVAFGSL